MEEKIEKVKDPNGYRIKCGRYYPVYRTEYAGYVFYKMPCGNLMINGSKTPVYKNVSFVNKDKDTNIPDASVIKPLSFYESGFFKKGDTYNVIWTIVITDWEIRDDEEKEKTKAISEYNKSINMEDIDFNDDLPF